MSIRKSNRLVVVAFALFALVGGKETTAAPISVLGDVMYFASPATYPPGTPVLLSIELGYGVADNTIGSGLFVDGIGSYDLSHDPALPAFITHATNGQWESMKTTVSDSFGNQASATFDPVWSEFMFLGAFPDLGPRTITRAVMHVRDYDLESLAGMVVVGVQWEFYYVPEPTTALLFLTVGLFGCLGTALEARSRRARTHG